MAQRWTHAPTGSRWGEFGPDDQRGRMNLVTPAKVLQGVAEVKEGRTFCLSLPLDVPGGQTGCTVPRVGNLQFFYVAAVEEGEALTRVRYHAIPEVQR